MTEERHIEQEARPVETHKINPNEILKDIHSDMDNQGLMQKYHLSEHQLKIVFEKLIEKGLIQKEELSKRNSASDEAQPMTWECPHCHMPQSHEFEECPQCGVIVAKFLAEQQAKLEKANTSTYTKKRMPLFAQAVLSLVPVVCLIWIGWVYFDEYQEHRKLKRLFDACQRGDSLVAREMLSLRVDPFDPYLRNYYDSDDGSLLMTAIDKDYDDLAILLLDDDWRSHPRELIEAAWKGKTEIVKLILRNTDVNSTWRAHSMATALEYAAEKGHGEVVLLLLQWGAKNVCEAETEARKNGHQDVAAQLFRACQDRRIVEDKKAWENEQYLRSEFDKCVRRCLARYLTDAKSVEYEICRPQCSQMIRNR